MNNLIKYAGIVLAIAGAILMVISKTCPATDTACIGNYVYEGLTVWLIGTVMWLGGHYITPEFIECRRKRYAKRRRIEHAQKRVMHKRAIGRR